MIQRLRFEGGVNGFHFCTLNLEKSTQRILETLNWAGIPSVLNKLIVVRIIISKVLLLYAYQNLRRHLRSAPRQVQCLAIRRS